MLVGPHSSRIIQLLQHSTNKSRNLSTRALILTSLRALKTVLSVYSQTEGDSNLNEFSDSDMNFISSETQPNDNSKSIVDDNALTENGDESDVDNDVEYSGDESEILSLRRMVSWHGGMVEISIVDKNAYRQLRTNSVRSLIAATVSRNTGSL